MLVVLVALGGGEGLWTVFLQDDDEKGKKKRGLVGLVGLEGRGVDMLISQIE